LQFFRDVGLVVRFLNVTNFFLVTHLMQFHLKYFRIQESLRTAHQDKTAAKVWWTFIYEYIFSRIMWTDGYVCVIYMLCGESSVRAIYKMYKTIIPLNSFCMYLCICH
jgi:hypothetical protein